MTTMLLPLGQAPHGVHIATEADCVIRHAGTAVPVTELAYLTWHACAINPRRATTGRADRDTVCQIIARALRTGVGPIRHLDPRDGIAQLRDAELLAELQLPQGNEPARPGVGSAWRFFESHRLVPGPMMTQTEQANQITGEYGESDASPVVAEVVRASGRVPRLVCALVEAVADDYAAGEAAYHQVIEYLPMILGLGVAHLERADPYNSPRVARFLEAAPPDPRRNRTG